MQSNIHNSSHLLVSIAMLTTAVTLVEPLALWVLLLVFCSVIMRLAIYTGKQKRLPSVRSINLLGILCALALAYFGLTLGLLLSMVNLLAMASALKLMLLRNNRDYFQLVAAQLFLVGSGFIFQQSILFTLLYISNILMLLLSIAYQLSPQQGMRQHMRDTGKLCLQALPICLLLFFILPQLRPLWKMPGNKGAKTGLSETVTPGDIASLSQSSDLAFRVTFEDKIPQPQQRYWRAIVLENFDGKTWRMDPQRKRATLNYYRSNQPFTPALTGDYFDYQVLAEPSQQRWLFALDVAYSQSDETWLTHDYTLVSPVPLANQMQYQVRSYYQTPLTDGLNYLDQRINTQLPQGGNPKTQRWVAELQERFPGRQDFINAVLSYYLNQDFRYTLRPDAMPINPIDSFLFQHRAGFCAHYASSFAYIMRLAGIPARMVTGYLGGEMREERYMSVYQYDAHAWVELWHPVSGWVRHDPTALVSPDRLSFGLQQAVAYENSFLADSPFALAALRDIEWLNQVHLYLADADYFWSRWILGFNQDKQKDLFRAIVGNLEPHRIAALSTATVFIIGLLLLLFQYRIWFPKIENLPLHHYQKALKALAKQGFERQAHQGPKDFEQQILQHLPAPLGQAFQALTQQFIALNYGPTPENNQGLRQLQQQVKHFVRQLKRTRVMLPSQDKS